MFCTYSSLNLLVCLSLSLTPQMGHLLCQCLFLLCFIEKYILTEQTKHFKIEWKT
jgi:hypothetical protein